MIKQTTMMITMLLIMTSMNVHIPTHIGSADGAGSLKKQDA